MCVVASVVGTVAPICTRFEIYSANFLERLSEMYPFVSLVYKQVTLFSSTIFEIWGYCVKPSYIDRVSTALYV